MKKKKIVGIAGPTGAGKDKTVERFIQENENFLRVPRCTTRLPRKGEIDGHHYHFISRSTFIEWRECCRIFAVDEFCGEFYGLDLQEITEALCNGRHVIGVFGICTLALKEMFPDRVIGIYLTAPLKILEERMRLRGDDLNKIPQRIEAAQQQLIKEPPLFDHVIENVGDIQHAVAAIVKLIGKG